MAHRGNESPMDFQWQTTGPVDTSSPFHKLAMDNAKKRRKLIDPKSIFSLTEIQGTHTAFNSPSKNNFPSLREPNGKPYFFNPTPKQTPKSPYREPSFTTPRKNFDLDFSSGPESSPMQQPEEDTPDGKPLPPIPVEFKSSPKPAEKRNSLFNFYGKYAPSPTATSGRGEIKKPHSDALAKRIYKKRRQGQSFERQLALARVSTSDETDSNSDSDEPSTRTKSKNRSKKEKKTHEVGWMTGLFTFIHTYPDAPSIIAKYLQVFFNAIILSICLYVFYSFYATIRADVDKASEEAMADLLTEMTECSKSYIENSCGSARRPPALDAICAQWEQCMNRDPAAVKRARLSAHTFAEIFNSFVEPISLKTMVFSIVVVGLALFINNATFSIYRKSQESHNEGYRHPSSQQYPHPPNTPHIGQIGQFAMTPGYPYAGQPGTFWTPGHIQGQDQGQGQLGYDQSPTRDRGRSRSPEKKRLALEN